MIAIVSPDLASQALANLRAQKTRTLLTALGIVFGVGSVIGMLAIGAGAREESLRFIEQLGVRNVLIESRPATSQEELQQRRRSSPGLDGARRAHPAGQHRGAGDALGAAQRCIRRACCRSRRADMPELYGVRPSYAHRSTACSWRKARSSTRADDAASAAVCVLGERRKVNLLGYGPAVGKFVKVNDTWLRSGGRADEQLMSGSRTAAQACRIRTTSSTFR